MPTFTLRRKDGTTEETKYTELMVIAGTQVHKLALHKTPLGNWVVSEPKSGAAIVRSISGWHKGAPISTRGFTLREVRALAQGEVDNLISRIGSDRFNATLADPKPF